MVSRHPLFILQGNVELFLHFRLDVHISAGLISPDSSIRLSNAVELVDGILPDEV